ncbi:MAG TPA: hypothetical protein PLI18_09785 [Pirellulaceae bacterium]|nr:hypothetical protein [Pirellulaceae bacterium]
MIARWVRSSSIPLAVGFAFGLTLAVGFAIGALVRPSSDSASLPSTPAELIRQIELRADSAANGKSLAMCTGRIDGDIEGLYVLDYTSGNLFCWVLNTRGGGFLAQYVTNVRNDFGPLEQGRNPDYLMVTGYVNPAGGAGADGRPAESIVYVADANSGAVVGYSLLWSRTRAAAGGGQGGGLIKVAQGLARDATLIRQ